MAYTIKKPTFEFSKKINIDEKVRVDVKKEVDTDVDLDGNLGHAEAFNQFGSTFTYAGAEKNYGSEALSQSTFLGVVTAEANAVAMGHDSLAETLTSISLDGVYSSSLAAA